MHVPHGEHISTGKQNRSYTVLGVSSRVVGRTTTEEMINEMAKCLGQLLKLAISKIKLLRETHSKHSSSLGFPVLLLEGKWALKELQTSLSNDLLADSISKR